ncbi:interferon-induced protein with tetratricopeptide repeats 5-like [Leucoraja erinacea]|uniref:interferon-induced protein with tetratricopeptide repeats 5-like n=1 Tax=Leucoraja erinaceus TaxID=7782 RepID=UPI002457ECD8|nr:interferon-induced protein with tetratricopeptide repeats 5-like [Leucoraja erinacea]XP_055503256.1 interferon-induced protein with tetratricopeptide repeats 5-like [Leucoraja erinacea]
MSDTLRESLLVKLGQLQCHFTWKLRMNNSDLDDVKQRLQDSIIIGGNHQGVPHNQLAYINYLQGNYEEALRDLEEAERRLREIHGDGFERRSIVTHGNRAWLHYHMGQLSEAQSYLDKLEVMCGPLTQGPHDTAMVPEVWGEKGWSLLSSHSQCCEEAKECFARALEEDPDNTEWNMGYATALFRLAPSSGIPENPEVSPSVRQLRRVLELDPGASVARVMLALRLQEFQQKAEANELVKEALRTSPDSPYVLRYAAKFYRKQHDADKAIEVLKKALEFTPRSSILHHQMGICYRKKLLNLTKNKGSRDPVMEAELISRCKHHFGTAFQLRPSDVFAKLDFASICLMNGESDRAEEIYNDLRSLEDIAPDEKQAIELQLGLYELYHTKSESNAIHHFMEGLKIQRGTKQGKICYTKLEKIARRQITRNPYNSRAWGILGFLHREAGENSEAVECYEKALRWDRGNEEYLSALRELRPST